MAVSKEDILFFKKGSVKNNVQTEGKIKIVYLNLDTQFAASNCT